MGSALAAAACANASALEYGVEGIGRNTYKLHMTTQPGDRGLRHAELARQASALCNGAYKLTFQSDRVTICTDACEGGETTVAMLSCEDA